MRGTHDDREWLETDGLGGFASGTVGGARTRRYHALLLAATTPPTGRLVLVNGLDAVAHCDGRSVPLTGQRYADGRIHPAERARLLRFSDDPWPTWTYALPDGTTVQQEILVRRGAPLVAVVFKRVGGGAPLSLAVRPFLSGRDYHALHHENPVFRFETEEIAATGDGAAGSTAAPSTRVLWRPYDGVPGVAALHNGALEAARDWYRGFLYGEEAARGLDATEDLASPAILRYDLSAGEAVLLLAAGAEALPAGSAVEALRALRASERRRRARYPSRLHRAADDYVVRRGSGSTLVAGYPWFTDWGRDTFVALRGVCLAAGRLDAARDILLEWAGAVSEGMLPNRFPDRGDEPEFNAVDASLWYVVAVYDYLRAAAAAGVPIDETDRARLSAAVGAIVEGYARGTRFGIRRDADGLLAAGVAGVQLTWMDARIGDWVVTPRIGKPVEVQALWVNALRVAAEIAGRPADDWRRAAAAFRDRFVDPRTGGLFDVVDVDHRPGAVDATTRPNQILAVGGLPFPLLEGEAAARVVRRVEEHLLTPLGLRSLAPADPAYSPRYEGGILQRDGSYHQGTVWPWLLGPFVEAWVRVRGGTAAARREARERFLVPMFRHLREAGLGHVSEIADAEATHTPRGCPFQAWSVGELLRLSEVVLAAEDAPAGGQVLEVVRRPPESLRHPDASVRS